MDQFAYYEFARDLPEMTAATHQLELRLRDAGHTALADRILRAYAQLIRDLETAAVAVSAAATDILRKSERDTRVRPDTQGGGGPRLEDSLVAEPVAPSQLPGSVGVANETLLDRDVPWWSTNEEGSSARVGKPIFGFFYGSEAAGPPDSTMSRAHSLFQPGRSPVSGKGIIHEPIPARRFILKAIPEIDKVWHREFEAARGRFDRELTAVMAGSRRPR